MKWILGNEDDLKTNKICVNVKVKPAHTNIGRTPSELAGSRKTTMARDFGTTEWYIKEYRKEVDEYEEFTNRDSEIFLIFLQPTRTYLLKEDEEDTHVAFRAAVAQFNDDDLFEDGHRAMSKNQMRAEQFD